MRPTCIGTCVRRLVQGLRVLEKTSAQVRPYALIFMSIRRSATHLRLQQLALHLILNHRESEMVKPQKYLKNQYHVSNLYQILFHYHLLFKRQAFLLTKNLLFNPYHIKVPKMKFYLFGHPQLRRRPSMMRRSIPRSLARRTRRVRANLQRWHQRHPLMKCRQ